MSEFVGSPWAPTGLSVKPEQPASPPQGLVRVEPAYPAAPRAPAALAPNPGMAEAAPPGSPAPAAFPAPSLASLLSQARSAGAGLAAQPLPIANRDTLLIQKLFGG